MTGLAKKTRIVVNFGPLKSGGGQNVALNFLSGIQVVKPEEVDFIYIVARGTTIDLVLSEHKGASIFRVPKNPFFRILYERVFLSWRLRSLKPDVVYSYFGWCNLPRSLKQVSGSADSNLYFPEVDFWGEEPLFKRLARWAVDRYRVYGIKRSDAVVFENVAMQARGEEIYSLRETKFIPPSIALSASDSRKFDLCVRDSRLRLLFFCGWQRNKNVGLIPSILHFLLARGVEAEVWITASPDGSALSNEVVEQAETLGVLNRIRFLGPVDKEHHRSLYRSIDFVLLLSKLESFSNNIIEAWAFERPLVVANEKWARSICGSAASYVDRSNVKCIADCLIELVARPESVRFLLEQGSARVKRFPSISERTIAEIGYLVEIGG